MAHSGPEFWPLLPTSCAEELTEIDHASIDSDTDVSRIAVEAPNRKLLQKLRAEQVLLLTPVVDVDVVAAIGESASHTSMIATVDHYVHVERLAQAATAAKSVVKVVIAVDTGAQFFGCRPGPEVVQLAKAIQKRSGLQLLGLTSQVPAHRLVHGLSAEDQAFTALSDTAEKLRREMLAVEFLHLWLDSPITGDDRVTDPAHGWHLTTESTGSAPLDSTPDLRLTRNRMPDRVTATVVCRPALHRAVLCCEQFDGSELSQTKLYDRQTPLTVLANRQHLFVVDLSDVNFDAVIGQTIELRCEVFRDP